MCGIAGKISSGRAADPALARQMCEALRHRGPDSAGMHVEEEAALVMRRLAVIDLVAGEQPIYSEDGRLVLVLNGEIYNHHELRDQLSARGHRFAGGSDAEVVVHLYEELGAGCVEPLRGMFAFAIWDTGRRRLLLARDRLGKKPLRYAHRGNTLWFGSEPRAILQDPELPRELSVDAIDAFLGGGYVPRAHSAFRGIATLPPASVLTWQAGARPKIERYWQPGGSRLEVEAEEAAELIREAILTATRARLEADVPVGAFLSGGIDSSVVVAAMAQSSAEPVRTFSVTFGDDQHDESAYARLVAERYGTIHTELRGETVDPQMLMRLAWHLGEPLADPAAVPTFQLAELTRRHVTVALSGDGGDELFCGYRRHWQLAATRPAELLPVSLRHRAAALAGALADPDGEGTGSRIARLARRLALPPPRRYAELMAFFGEADRRLLYGPAMQHLLDSEERFHHLDRAWEQRAGLPWAERAAALDLDTYLPDDLLTKLDLTSMAHGLEVRSPLLDHELVELATSLPAGLKLRGRTGKLALRDAAAPWLPAEVLNRPKHGFSVPIDSWLRGPLRSLLPELLLDRRARERGLFDPDAVARTIAAHRDGFDRSGPLWAMLSVELWCRSCLDRAVASADELPVAV